MKRAALQTDQKTSQRLGQIRQASTAPELAVRSALNRMGVRFRVGGRGLPGSPDIVNKSGRWAVFVHGCFWHRHRGCARTTTPKRNRSFWVAKFTANKKRDRRVVKQLRALGYFTVIVWECQTTKVDFSARRLRELKDYIEANRDS